MMFGLGNPRRKGPTVLKPYEALADEKLVEQAFASNVAVRYLVSDEPSSQLSDELATFGQFVGSWDLTMDSITRREFGRSSWLNGISAGRFTVGLSRMC